MTPTLNEKLISIGVRITLNRTDGKKTRNVHADIEETLLEAILNSAQDGRLVSLLMTWLKIHGSYVNVERLMKLARRYPHGSSAARLLSGYAAFAVEHCGQKWKKLIHRSKEPIYLYPKEITDSAVELKGAIDFLKKAGFIVPNGSIRIRDEDVFTPEELIASHPQYRNRYLYGPSWRADIISAIEAGAKSPTEIARSIGCSYEPAHRVFREYCLVKSAA